MSAITMAWALALLTSGWGGENDEAAGVGGEEAGTATNAKAAAIVLRFELYRIRGNIDGTTSLTDNVWRELKGSNPYSREFPFSVFTVAEQNLAGIEFKASDEGGWSWGGQREPPAGSRIQKVASPVASARIGQAFHIEVRSDAPQYFKPDGRLFELLTSTERPGLQISTTVHRITEGEQTRIVLKDLIFESLLVEKREPLDGVGLDVGKPIFRKVKEQTTLSLLPDRDYGIDIRVQDGQGLLRCRLRASFPE